MDVRVDTLGFLAPQGAPPVADAELGRAIDVMHVTAVPPMLDTVNTIIKGHERMPGLERFRQFVDEQPGLMVAEASADLVGAGSDGKTRLVLGVQEAPRDATAEGLLRIKDLGVRVVTLSYKHSDHPLGSGYTSGTGRLTDRGAQFLRDCQTAGLAVDLSHVGHETAKGVLDLREQENLHDLSVVATHGGVFELFDGDRNHPNNLRNLPEETLIRIAEAGGIIGIYALTFGLSEKDNSLLPMIRQLVYAHEHIGPGAVTIGTDTPYTARDVDEWQRSYERLAGQLVSNGEMSARWPDYPTALNTPRKVNVIRNALQKDGSLSPEAIANIVGGNALRFFQKLLDAPQA